MPTDAKAPKMKRSATFLAFLLATFTAGPARAVPPATSQEVVEKAFDAVNHGKFDAFVKAMHPDALNEFRTTVLELLDTAIKAGNESKVLEELGVKTAEELKALDGGKLIVAMMAKLTAEPEAKKMLASTKVDAIGKFSPGADENVCYVVYRSMMKFGEMSLDRLNAAKLIKSGPEWKLALSDEAVANLAVMKAAATGDPKQLMKSLDPSAMQIEPLGHVLEGKKTALVVYRTSIPVGDSAVSKLAVLKVNSGDPGWDAARKDQADEVKALIEKSLGITKKPSEAESAALKEANDQKLQEMRARSRPAPAAPKPAMSPEFAARKAEMDREFEEAKARMEAMRNRPLGAGKPAPGAEGREAEPAPGTPEGLTAFPPTFFGGDRGRFFDVAPKGGMLVGVRVTYITKLGGPKISSIRPVFRVGEKQLDGKLHGTQQGKETRAIAKPGYAVGAVNTRTGITVDGFELVFMKVDGDQLDTSDAYKSPWLGDERGGSARNVDSDGRLPVGLQGRADREVNALGLLAGE